MTPIRNVSDRERQLCAEIEALKLYVAKLEPDAMRYRWLQHKTRGVYGVTSDQEFVLPHVHRVAGQDLMRGSVAQHLDKAIDAAMKESAP